MKALFRFKFLALASVITLVGCKYDLADPEYGVTYLEAPSDLTVDNDEITASETGAVNFDTEEVYFEAVASDPSTWTITITGTESGAERLITGTGSVVDSSNSVWKGASDNIFFFKRGEAVNVELSFLGIDKTVTNTTLSVGTPPTFDGILISDFELPGEDQGLLNMGGFFFYFDEVGADEQVSKTTTAGEFTDVNENAINVDVQPIQGDHFFHVHGADRADQPDDFFIGGLGHNFISYGITSALDNTYFNCFINHGGVETTAMEIQIYGVGGDQFGKEISVDWEGWQMVTVKLSDFVQTASGPLGPGELDPALIGEIRMQIKSGLGESGNPAQINVDYIILTEGKPFSQR